LTLKTIVVILHTKEIYTRLIVAEKGNY